MSTTHEELYNLIRESISEGGTIEFGERGAVIRVPGRGQEFRHFDLPPLPEANSPSPEPIRSPNDEVIFTTMLEGGLHHIKVDGRGNLYMDKAKELSGEQGVNDAPAPGSPEWWADKGWLKLTEQWHWRVESDNLILAQEGYREQESLIHISEVCMAITVEPFGDERWVSLLPIGGRDRRFNESPERIAALIDRARRAVK